MGTFPGNHTRSLMFDRDCHRTAGFLRATGSTEFVLANHLNNTENVPSLEVFPRMFTST